MMFYAFIGSHMRLGWHICLFYFFFSHLGEWVAKKKNGLLMAENSFLLEIEFSIFVFHWMFVELDPIKFHILQHFHLFLLDDKKSHICVVAIS